jgi:hypothetical protein
MMKNILFIICCAALFEAGCASFPSALLTEGQIIAVDEDRVFVIFRDYDKLDRHTGGWFYLPGLGVLDKDQYKVKLVITPKFQNHE